MGTDNDREGADTVGRGADMGAFTTGRGMLIGAAWRTGAEYVRASGREENTGARGMTLWVAGTDGATVGRGEYRGTAVGVAWRASTCTRGAIAGLALFKAGRPDTWGVRAAEARFSGCPLRGSRARERVVTGFELRASAASARPDLPSIG